MNNFVNGSDSIITCAPELQTTNSTLSSNLPKPFEKLSHLRDPLVSSLRSESPKSPALVNPHNRAWLDSPDSFIGRIPESNLMEDCVAFIDVWSTEGNDNRSIVFARILSRMGATIAQKFTKNEKITHLVFKDGHKSYLQKAKKRRIKIVNCLWVDKCRRTQTWVEEEPYIFDDSNYVPPKKFREMQPLYPEEEQVRSAERARRRQKREEIKNSKKAVAFLSPLVSNNQTEKNKSGAKKTTTLAFDTPYRPTSHSFFHPRLVSETPSESILRKLQRMKEGKPIFSPPSSPLSDSSQTSEITSTIGLPNVAKSSSSIPVNEANVIPSSQHLSDMDVTCVVQGPIKASEIEAIVLNDLEASDRANTSKDNSGNSETSRICLQISGSSKSFSDNSTAFNLDDSKESTPPQTRIPVDPPPIPEEVPKRARRRLCEDEVLRPASILLSPTPRNIPVTKPPPRRSRRLSSLTASQAISMIYKPRTSSQSNDSVLTQDSTLPPVGLSAAKSASRRRFFEPIRTSTSVYEETCDSSDDSRTARSCQSVSTAYEDAANHDTEYDFHEGDHQPLKLSSKKSSSRLSNRTITTSTSTSDKENETTLTNRSSGKRKTRRQKKKSHRILDKESILHDITEAPKPRRSTDEFHTVPLSETVISQRQKNRKRKTKNNSILVLTSLHYEERIAMEKIVRRLGHFRVRSSVKDKRASHVVCGAERRTMNVLHAITRGLWLLSKDWLVDSMRAGKWLDEEEYEVDYFPVAKQARKLRDESPNWNLPLFRSVKGHVYVSPDTEPPQNELCELVTSCGGHVIGSPRRAVVRVGRWVTVQYSLPAVKETWILDSITENTLLPTQDYWIQ